MSIKQRLFSDFGYDLNIAGGLGQSVDDPIHVLSETEQDAYQTQYMVLRGLGQGRKVIWRTLEINRTSDEASQLLQYKIETKEDAILYLKHMEHANLGSLKEVK